MIRKEKYFIANKIPVCYEVLQSVSGACSTHGIIKNVYKILVGEPDEKRPFSRLKHNLER
jgi:hypothetical protein